MKKRMKHILLILLVVVVVVAVVGFVNIYPMLTMNPTPTGSVIGDTIGTDILALNNGANSLYFIPSEDGYILVDAGSNADGVAQNLPFIGVEPEDVTHILLTHSDYDHVAALTLFPNAQIYMSADELQMVDGTTKRNFFSRNTLPEGVDIGGISLLQDGQQLQLGSRTVSCISLPGHTTGSMAYLMDGLFLFTGDAIQVKSGKVSTHPYTMSTTAAKLSIDKLLAVKDDADIILTAHYGWYEPGDIR